MCIRDSIHIQVKGKSVRFGSKVSVERGTDGQTDATDRSDFPAANAVVGTMSTTLTTMTTAV